MATIFIQGEKEEIQKAVCALNVGFDVVNKKGTVPTGAGTLCVYDVSNKPSEDDKKTDEEINVALECCSNKERNCSICPYKNVDGCKDALQMDAAIMIRRKIANGGAK